MDRASLICWNCAIAKDGRPPSIHISSYYLGKCEVCDTVKAVTQSRDFIFEKDIGKRVEYVSD